MSTLLVTSNTTIVGTFTNNPDLTTVTEKLNHGFATALTNGTGANQANQHWSDQRTVTAASENLDLAGGLTDAFGATVTFTKVKELLIHNRSTTSGEDLTLSGTFLNNDMLGGGSSTMVLGPGGDFHVKSPVDGFTVTADTGDVLTVNPGAATITYDIVIIGTV